MFERERNEFNANCTKADGCYDCNCERAFDKGVETFAIEVGNVSGFWGRTASRLQNKLSETQAELVKARSQLNSLRHELERYENYYSDSLKGTP